MARSRGRDVVIELMDAVEALQATSQRHTEQLEALAQVSMETVAHVTALTQTVGTLSHTVGTLSNTVGTLSHTVGTLTQRVEALESDVRRLSEGFVAAAANSRLQTQQLAQVGRLIGQLAEGAQDRFERIESRLTKLERAS